MKITRRTALRSAFFGITALAIDGGVPLLTAKEARAAGLPYVTLTRAQAAILDALGDRLAPGAAEKGISHFVDQQISIPAPEALLTLRYLDIAPPYSSFYASTLAAVDASSKTIYSAPFVAINDAERDDLISTMATGTPDGWNSSIPAPIFYFAVRSDAVDVVYGTIEGFEQLNIPYMPHIVPPGVGNEL
jgi:Gluconate 2-dehydrogenase subunit 3